MAQDGLSWTFYLKTNVRFHDGTPFNAQAVAANLDRIMNPDLGSQKARFLLGPYSSYEVIDDSAIKINLSEPYAPLLDGLSQVYLGIASPKALQETTKNTYQWHQVGTGPYRLAEFLPGDHIILQRNEDYDWGPVFYAPITDQSIATVEFRFYEDPPTRSLALESGEIQVIGELLPTDAERLAGNTALHIYRVALPGTPQQFFLNTKRAPLDQLSVRQALLYATNRTAIVEAVYQGQSPVAYGPLSAVTPFYSAEVATSDRLAYPHDTEYARSLLAGLGYADSDDDGILDVNGEPLKLTMVFGPWNQMPDVAQLIKDQWRDLGIDLELLQVPDFPSLVDRATAGDYDLIALYDFGVDASILNQYFLSGGPRNWSGYSDPELDNWLAEATRQSDPEVRAPLYLSAQQRIMEQAILLPIRDVVNLDGATARLDGVIFSAQGWWPLLRNLQLAP
jgi:peptide/nickel transport system substrate-binding protein